MTDPTHIPLTPDETDALVQRAVRGGRRRLRTRRIASGVAAVAVVGALGVGAFSIATLPGRAPLPASPGPVSLSKAPEAPTPSPLPFDENTQRDLESLLATRLGVRLNPQAADDPRPDDRYVATGTLDDGSGVPVTVMLGPLPLDAGDARKIDAPSEDDTFWKLDLASSDVAMWARERADGATITLRVGLGNLSQDEAPEHAPPLSEAEAVDFLSSPDWDPLLDAVAASR